MSHTCNEIENHRAEKKLEVVGDKVEWIRDICRPPVLIDRELYEAAHHGQNSPYADVRAAGIHRFIEGALWRERNPPKPTFGPDLQQEAELFLENPQETKAP